MEIQNTQGGQAFALPNVTPIRTDTDVQKESSGSENKESNHRNNDSLATLQIRDSFSIETNKELSQASGLQADNVRSTENDKQLDDAISKVESFLKVQNRDLAFSIDEETNRSIVTVKDSQSGDVIRQIPSEEVLELAERIQELQQDVGNSVGVFINNQV